MFSAAGRRAVERVARCGVMWRDAPRYVRHGAIHDRAFVLAESDFVGVSVAPNLQRAGDVDSRRMPGAPFFFAGNHLFAFLLSLHKRSLDPISNC